MHTSFSEVTIPLSYLLLQNYSDVWPSLLAYAYSRTILDSVNMMQLALFVLEYLVCFIKAEDVFDASVKLLYMMNRLTTRLCHVSTLWIGITHG